MSSNPVDLIFRILARNDDALRGMADVERRANSLGRQVEGTFGGMGTRIAAGVTAGIAAWETLERTITRVLDEIGAANEVVDDLVAGQGRMRSAASLAGIELERLTGVAASAREEFLLTDRAAQDFAVLTAQVAKRVGDLTLAEEGLAAALKIGAAEGLSAERALHAFRQGLIGVDEGTDLLFQKNPSELFAEYGREIGKSATQLNSAERAMAVTNAAIEKAAVIQGEYLDLLPPTVRALAQQNQALEEARRAFGEALTPARIELYRQGADVLRQIAGALRENQTELQQFASDMITAAGAVVTLTEKIGGLAAKLVGEEDALNLLASITLGTAGGAVVGGLIGGPAGAVGGAGRGLVAGAAGSILTQPNRTAARTIEAERRRIEEAQRRFGIALEGGGGIFGLSDFDVTGSSSASILNRFARGAIAGNTAPFPQGRRPPVISGGSEIPAPPPPLNLTRAELFGGAEGLPLLQAFTDMQMQASMADVARVLREIDVEVTNLEGKTVLPGLPQAVADAERFTDLLETQQRELQALTSAAETFADSFFQAMLHAADGTATLEDALGSVARSLGALGLRQGLGNLVEGFREGLGPNGRPTGALGALAGILGSTNPVVAGGLVAGGFALSVLPSLLGGGSREREEEMYRANLRALRDARQENVIDVQIVLPSGMVNADDPRWQELVAETLDRVAAGHIGNVELVRRG